MSTSDLEQTLEVARADLHDTRVVERPVPAPKDGAALLRVERFGLTANNITYAVLGDMLRYWELFPAEEGWGRIPMWARPAWTPASGRAGAGSCPGRTAGSRSSAARARRPSRPPTATSSTAGRPGRPATA